MKQRNRLLALLATTGLALAACGGSDGDKGGADGGPVTITMWHANVDTAAKMMEDLAAEFHASHPNITVQVEQGSPGDQMLSKLSTVLSTDKRPDIAYVFGTDTPSLARSEHVVDLTEATKDPAWGWSDFYEGERAVATVNGKVVAVPALVDNLAVVYNKKLFADAGVAVPTGDMSWDDFRQTALAMTDSAKGIFGTGYPIGGDEDTVWRFWPMVWQQGGKAISDDGKSATFDTPEFATALGLLRTMAIDDQSIYLDANPEAQLGLFASGQIAMVITGPWALGQFIETGVDYGVAPLPGFNGNHETVSGPDNWMVFDNGSARSAAAIEFLKFLTSPESDAKWSVGLGNMPVRNATQKSQAWADALKATPGFKEFVDNFANSKSSRPQTTVYPAYSKALGDAIASVLTGDQSVEEALKAATAAGNAALADA